MNSNKRIKSTIQAISSSPLFMEKNAAMNLMHRYNSLIDSKVFENEQLTEKHLEKMEELTSVSFHSASKSVVLGKFGNDFKDVPSGSVAVVPVMGVMARDTYCSMSNGYISGTRDLETTVQALDQNDNVEGIVFYINTPGGQATGNEALSKKIQSLKTPTVGLFETMASAGVAAFQGLDEIYGIESSSQWGSIGTYVSFYNDRKFFEDMGLELIEVYADQSTEKNKAFREAIEGNKEPLKEELTKMTDSFIKQVKKARPSIKDDGKVFKGKSYNASEAIKLNAIDGIGDLNFAINRARYLYRNGKKKKKSNAKKNQAQTTMENEKKVSWWSTLWGNKDLDEAKEDINVVKNKMNSLEQSKKDLEESLNAKEVQLQAMTTSNQEASKELEALKEQNSSLLKEKEALESQANQALEGTEFDNLQSLKEDYKKVIAHNVELGGRERAETPVDSQQNVSHKTDAIEKPLTIAEKVAAINKKIEAEAKAKKEEK